MVNGKKLVKLYHAVNLITEGLLSKSLKILFETTDNQVYQFKQDCLYKGLHLSLFYELA